MSNFKPFSIGSDDILFPGDIIGEGIPLQAEPLRLVPNQSFDQTPLADYRESAREFEVVRKRGTGSHAIVYLVREILFHFPRFQPEDDSDHMYPAGHHPSREYGREYAIKILSKVDLDEKELTAQSTEVMYPSVISAPFLDLNATSQQATIHQAIPVHPNIVTLHLTLETSAFLVLVLEYVPGRDLLYCLKHVRNHYEGDS